MAGFQPTHGNLKTTKYSPVGHHRGADLGSLEIAPGTLSLVRESIENRKVEWDAGPNQHTVVAVGQPSVAHHGATTIIVLSGPISGTRGG